MLELSEGSSKAHGLPPREGQDNSKPGFPAVNPASEPEEGQIFLDEGGGNADNQP